MLDMVDGAVARAGGTASPFGGVLDSTGDRAADAAIFGALVWYFGEHGQRWLLLAALLCLVLGSITSYIRARAEAAGFTATVGIVERPERLIIVLVGTGLTGAPFARAVRAGDRAVGAGRALGDHRRAAAGDRAAAVAATQHETAPQ